MSAESILAKIGLTPSRVRIMTHSMSPEARGTSVVRRRNVKHFDSFAEELADSNRQIEDVTMRSLGGTDYGTVFGSDWAPKSRISG